MTAEPLPSMPGPRRCSGCNRMVVARTLWVKFTPQQRKELHATHARYQSDGMCCTCYRREHPSPPRPDVQHRDMEWPKEAWVRKGLILVPVGPRPVDAESPNPRYQTRSHQLIDLFGIGDQT